MHVFRSARAQLTCMLSGRTQACGGVTHGASQSQVLASTRLDNLLPLFCQPAVVVLSFNCLQQQYAHTNGPSRHFPQPALALAACIWNKTAYRHPHISVWSKTQALTGHYEQIDLQQDQSTVAIWRALMLIWQPSQLNALSTALLGTQHWHLRHNCIQTATACHEPVI
jgi:hypothetical protein